MTLKLISTIAVLYTICTSTCFCFPSGAPLSVCEDMFPKHQVSPQEDKRYFIEAVPLEKFKSHDRAFKITIKSHTNDPIRGFLLEARENKNSAKTAFGTWETEIKDTHTNDCFGKKGSAITHSSPLDLKSLEFVWIPKDLQHQKAVTFIATVVKTHDEIYTEVFTVKSLESQSNPGMKSKQMPKPKKNLIDNDRKGSMHMDEDIKTHDEINFEAFTDKSLESQSKPGMKSKQMPQAQKNLIENDRKDSMDMDEDEHFIIQNIPLRKTNSNNIPMVEFHTILQVAKQRNKFQTQQENFGLQRTQNRQSMMNDNDSNIERFQETNKQGQNFMLPKESNNFQQKINTLRFNNQRNNEMFAKQNDEMREFMNSFSRFQN